MKNIKPILFCTKDVQAILNGEKTVTRRVIKPQPIQPVPLGFTSSSTCKKDIGCYGWGKDKYGGIIDRRRPIYNIGDILYVRETWQEGYRIGQYEEPILEYVYKAKGDDRYVLGIDPATESDNFALAVIEISGGVNKLVKISTIHRDSTQKIEKEIRWCCDNFDIARICSVEYSLGKWRPSIHMPKEAARIFLKITNIRVERLQEITALECVYEGVDTLDILENTPDDDFAGYAKGQFADHWDSMLNKEDYDEYSWEANPWVWVIEFEKVDVSVS